jgi:hypothetical protein
MCFRDIRGKWGVGNFGNDGGEWKLRKLRSIK